VTLAAVWRRFGTPWLAYVGVGLRLAFGGRFAADIFGIRPRHEEW